MGDWATILARQEFGVSKSAAVIPYFLFMGAMIMGRFSFARFKGERSDKEIVQPLVISGGTIFLVGLFLGLQVNESNQILGFAIFCLTTFLAGIGISFVGPLFFNYASIRSGKPGGVAVAELGAVNQILSFLGRNIFAVFAGATSLPIAMIMPALMLVMVAFFVAEASKPKP